MTPDEQDEIECDRPRCQRIAATASEVYCEITGGQLSYPTYEASTILAHAGDHAQRLINEAVEYETGNSPNVYEAFIAEMDALTILADESAVSVVGQLTRAVKRAQMVADGELNPQPR